jgi:hypothetical protein
MQSADQAAYFLGEHLLPHPQTSAIGVVLQAFHTPFHTYTASGGELIVSL